MIDQNYVNNLVSAINGIPDCRSLAKFLEKEAADLFKQMESSLSSASTLSGLSTVPTDLISAIKWIENMIKNMIGPMQKAIQTYIETVAAYTKIMAAIQKKAAELGCATQLASVTGLKIPNVTLPFGTDASTLTLAQIQSIKLPTLPALPTIPTL